MSLCSRYSLQSSCFTSCCSSALSFCCSQHLQCIFVDRDFKRTKKGKEEETVKVLAQATRTHVSGHYSMVPAGSLHRHLQRVYGYTLGS